MPLGLFMTANAQEPMQSEETALRIGLRQPIDSLNPFIGVTDSAYLFWQFIYDNLITVDEDMQPKPNLATSWYAVPEYEPYGSVWQYNLTRNATWHDGEPFVADDVVFTIEMQIGLNFDTVWAYQPYTALIDSIEKLDDYTVRIHYRDLDGAPSPCPFAESLMIPMIPEHIWGSMSIPERVFSYENLWPIGTGPFMCTNHTEDEYKSGDPITLLRNPDYHGAVERGDTVDFDMVVLVFYLEPLAMLMDIREGSLDLAAFDAPTFEELEAWLDSNPDAPIETYSGLQCSGFSVELSVCMQSNALNNLRRDPAVMKAMAYAANKEFIRDNVYQGYAEVGSTIISPVYGDLYWEPGPGEAYAFNLTKANETLDAAGYYWGMDGVRRAGVGNAYGPQDTPLTFEILIMQDLVEDRDTAMKLRDDFSKIGIEIDPRIVSIGLWSTLVYSYNYELAMTYWSGDPDPAYLLYAQTSHSIGAWSENGYSNPYYDENYSKYISATTHEQGRTAIHNCQELMYEDAAFMVTAYPFGCWGWRTDNFSGWGDWGAHPGRQLSNVWSTNQLYFDLMPIVSENAPPNIEGMVVAPNPSEPAEVVSLKVYASDPDSDPLIVTIEFGDGEKAVQSTPGGTTLAQQAWFNHSYSAVGLYSLRVWVNDSYGPATHNVTLYLADYVEVRLAGMETRIEYRLYDMFEEPWGEWWPYRLKSWKTDIILSNESHAYTMVYNPDMINRHGIIMAPYRWNVTATNMSTMSVNDPAIMPTFGPEVEGASVYLDLYWQYINKEWWNDHIVPTWSSNSNWSAGLADLIYQQESDGYYIFTEYNIRMNREAAETWLNIPQAVDPLTWWAANGDDYMVEWQRWIAYQGNWEFDIYPGYEWMYIDVGTLMDLSVDGDDVILSIGHFNWGYETLITRWMTDRAICNHEPYMEDFQMIAQFEPAYANMTYDAVAQYNLHAVKANLTESDAAWVWEPQHIDYISWPGSEFNPYEDLQYTSWNSGDLYFGEYVDYDFTPTYFNLTSYMTLTIQLPNRDDVIGYRGIGLPLGSVRDLMLGDDTAYKNIQVNGPMWLGYHLYPDVVGAPDLSSMYDNTTKVLHIQGPLDFDNYHHAGGELYESAPWIEFNVANYTWPGDDDLPPTADAGEDRTVLGGELVIFDGTGSDDDFGIVNWTWRFWYDGDWVELYGQQPQFTFWSEGVYVVELTVTDTGDQTDTDTVTITVSGFIPEFGQVAVLATTLLIALVALSAFNRQRRRRPHPPP
ncbi:MAG: hypothetical protein JW880_03475 [Candidatus Thermoplasmatota archaeon]|nr:hypothetical protein [Candidatus Thermoplasmatota archaeon]